MHGGDDIIESVADNLDFRKIVNEFLYNPKKGYMLIDKETRGLFNELYTISNIWIHPRKRVGKVNIEEESSRAIDILGKLLSLRDVMKEYDISAGKLVKKAISRKKIRPIELGKNRYIPRDIDK